MSFAQLTYRESLRDIEVCLNAQPNKLYHMGIKGHVSRTNLANANRKRDWRIYAEFAQVLISHARKLYQDDPEFIVDLDSTNICSGFNDNRFMSISFSVGKISQDQRGCKTSYFTGYSGVNTGIY
jgi:hypothetical protein